MSSDRIPNEANKLLLTLCYREKICTVQAMWNAVEIERLETEGKCIKVLVEPTFTVYVRRTEGSEYININIATGIVRRWLRGEYITVQSALIPTFPSRHIISM